MKKGSLIYNEIIGNSVESLKLFGCFTAPFPIKEIYKVKHSVPPVKTLIGKKGIAYFGEVNLQIFCVDEHKLTLHLVEESVCFRGFSLFSEAAEEIQPTIDIKAMVEDVFVEDISEESIKMLIFLVVEITCTREKERASLDVRQNAANGGYPKGGKITSRSTNEYHIVVEDAVSHPDLIIQDIKIE